MANLHFTVYRNVNVHNSGKFYYNNKRINMYVLAFFAWYQLQIINMKSDPFED